MREQHTRRQVLRLTSAGMLAAAGASASQAGREITVHATAGEKRHAQEAALHWRQNAADSAEITLDSQQRFQQILGFGAAFTDAACYQLHQLEAEARQRLLDEMFHPSQTGFNVGRLPIGASDYAAKAYSFDEGEPDPEMRRFSIDHDRAYILPILKAAREANPSLFLLGSPWSPPGWMKANGSLLGGNIRERYFDAYARYFVRFLEEYAAAGVKVDAVTVQNEVDTDQDGRMPACLWGQEYETGFVAGHLGPQLEQRKLPTKIWILDHNYNLWGRAICELDDRGVSRYVDGVAWHGYVGRPSAMTRVHDAHPEKHAYWTEGGPDLDDPRYATDWAHWSAQFTEILRHWARCIIGWNLVLDAEGKPNIGPFRCAGLVTAHSGTGEITRSGMYWALAHYSRALQRGARRIASTGNVKGVSHAAFVNPAGDQALILTNSGPRRGVTIRSERGLAETSLPAESVTTLRWG